MLDTVIKNACVIPMTEAALSTEEQGGAYTVKRIPGKETPYEFYTDAGDGYGYERGEYTIEILQ